MRKITLSMVLSLAVGAPGAVFGEAPDRAATVSTQAKISRAVAERTALGRVPHGSVQSAELEREHGRLIWSFDIVTAGSRDIKEVHVDANDGSVVVVATETPAQQAQENAADKHRAKKTHRRHRPQ
jgi:Peptidase propeptide and YPEB domain